MKFVFIIVVFLLPFLVHGQAELLERDGYTCYFKGETYKFKELSPILSKSPQAMKYYNSGLSKYSLNKGFVLTGLGIAIGGAYFIAKSNDTKAESFGVRIIMLGLIVELSSLIPKFIGDHKIRKAISIYNFEEIEEHGISLEPTISFKETNNGIGLVLSF